MIIKSALRSDYTIKIYSIFLPLCSFSFACCFFYIFYKYASVICMRSDRHVTSLFSFLFFLYTFANCDSWQKYFFEFLILYVILLNVYVNPGIFENFSTRCTCLLYLSKKSHHVSQLPYTIQQQTKYIHNLR